MLGENRLFRLAVLGLSLVGCNTTGEVVGATSSAVYGGQDDPSSALGGDLTVTPDRAGINASRRSFAAA